METYYLSYNPNDFYWVSVSGDYDLSICEDMIRPKKIRIDTKLGVNIHASSDVSGDCPCAKPTPEPEEDYSKFIRDTHIFTKNKYTDDPFYYQLCKNYVTSGDLKQLQKGASEGNQLLVDNQDKYFTQVLQITNMCIVIAAMALVLRA